LQEQKQFDASTEVVRAARTSYLYGPYRMFLYACLVVLGGTAIDACNTCHESIKAGERPEWCARYADYGVLSALPKISLAERLMSSRSFRYQELVKYHGTEPSKGVLSVRGHAISFPVESAKAAVRETTLPRTLTRSEMAVAFVGPKAMWSALTGTRSARKRFVEINHHTLPVSAQNVLKFLKTKQQLDPAYHDVHIDETMATITALDATTDTMLDEAIIADSADDSKTEAKTTDDVARMPAAPPPPPPREPAAWRTWPVPSDCKVGCLRELSATMVKAVAANGNVEEQADWPPIWQLGSIGGGDCGVASILQALNTNFAAMTPTEQVEHVRTFRSEILRDWYTPERHDVIIGSQGVSFNEALVEIATPLFSIGQVGMSVLAAYFGIDILVLTIDEQTGATACRSAASWYGRRAEMATVQHLLPDRTLSTVFLFHRDATCDGAPAGHYETLVRHAQSLFATTDPWIHRVRQNLAGRISFEVKLPEKPVNQQKTSPSPVTATNQEQLARASAAAADTAMSAHLQDPFSVAAQQHLSGPVPMDVTDSDPAQLAVIAAAVYPSLMTQAAETASRTLARDLLPQKPVNEQKTAPSPVTASNLELPAPASVAADTEPSASMQQPCSVAAQQHLTGPVPMDVTDSDPALIAAAVHPSSMTEAGATRITEASSETRAQATMEVSDEPELLFTSEGQHHVLISEPLRSVNVSDSDVLNVMATTIAPKLVNVPIGGGAAE